MGNYLSRASPSSIVPSFGAIKVIRCDGGVEEVQRRIKAAELMLENPQHFVCHASALHVGRRVSALGTDEDLEMGQLYFLLPMAKLQSVLSVADVASIKDAAAAKGRSSSKNAAKFREGKRKDCEEQIVVPKMEIDGLMELAAMEDLAKFRLSRCRSWKPKLETISEAPRVRG